MEKHLSDWHVFNPSGRKSYPKVDAPVQVRFDDGRCEEGDSWMFFPIDKLLPCSSFRRMCSAHDIPYL